MGERGDDKRQPLVGEISWNKKLIIMARCKDPLERALNVRVEDFLKAMGGMFAFLGSQRQMANDQNYPLIF